MGKRVAAGVLAVTAGFVAVWAEVFPRSFNDSFPVSGHSWVSPLGPYNEHAIRDVGGLYSALLVVSVWAVLRPQRETFAMIGSAWEAFSIPHLVFHCFHLNMFGTVDKIGNLVTLAGTVVLAALLVLPVRHGRAHSETSNSGGVSP